MCTFSHRGLIIIITCSKMASNVDCKGNVCGKCKNCDQFICEKGSIKCCFCNFVPVEHEELLSQPRPISSHTNQPTDITAKDKLNE